MVSDGLQYRRIKRLSKDEVWVICERVREFLGSAAEEKIADVKNLMQPQRLKEMQGGDENLSFQVMKIKTVRDFVLRCGITDENAILTGNKGKDWPPQRPSASGALLEAVASEAARSLAPRRDPSGSQPSSASDRTVVVVDLKDYSPTQARIAQNFGSAGVRLLDDSIQLFIQSALAAAGGSPDRHVDQTTGDGAHLIMDSAQQAVLFTINLHQATSEHNVTINVEADRRHFRVGAATGPLDGPHGVARTRAARLEPKAPLDGTLIDETTWLGLGEPLSALFDGPHDIEVKHGETIVAYRTPRGVGGGPTGGIQSGAAPDVYVVVAIVRIAGLLSGQPRLAELIADALAISKARAGPESLADELARALVGRQVGPTILALHGIHRALMARNDTTELSAVMPMLKQVARTIFLLIYDESQIAAIRGAVAGASGGVFVTIPAANSTFAEACMARFDGKDAFFDAPDGRNSWPPGEYKVSGGPQTGPDAFVESYVAGFEARVFQHTLNLEDERLTPDRRRARAKRRLAVRTEAGLRRLYYIENTRLRALDEAAYNAVLRRLRAEWPEVVFLSLGAQSEQLDQWEDELLLAARDMLP